MANLERLGLRSKLSLGYPTKMIDRVDYGRYTEAELLGIATHIDPRRAGDNFQRFRATLEAMGYVVEVNTYGHVSVALAANVPRRFLDVPARFSQSGGPVSWMEPSRNDFRLVGTGKIIVANAIVEIRGKALNYILGIAFPTRVTLDRQRISNVETTGCSVRFEYVEGRSRPKAITLHLADSSTAEQLVNLLPSARTSDFQLKLPGELKFDQVILSQHRRVPVTSALVIANVVVFLAMLGAGANFFHPSTTELGWGSNFGPYTTDGDWWRLLTSNFLHIGAIHLLFNMWALLAVGPLVERLYGSLAFLFIYLSAALIASLVSVVWAPVVVSVGASGPIFGVYGALFAALVGSSLSIPRSVISPLRNSTAIFVVSTLAAGLLLSGIDNAAHLGGLAAGFALGSVFSRRLAIYNTRQGGWAFGTAALFVAISLAAGGTFARYRSEHSGPEGQFWQTQHWMVHGESAATEQWINIRRLVQANKLDDAGFADAINSTVLPFWREADARLENLASPSDATVLLSLKNLRALANSRKSAFEMCVAAGRFHDASKGKQCTDGLALGNRLIKTFAM